MARWAYRIPSDPHYKALQMEFVLAVAFELYNRLAVSLFELRDSEIAVFFLIAIFLVLFLIFLNEINDAKLDTPLVFDNIP